MKLDQFINNVLQDVETAINTARSQNDKNYYIESKGISFDIAVTTSNTSGSVAESKAKLGIIEVLGAGVGAKNEDKTEDSQVSRIQFTVYVPAKTEKEYRQQSYGKQSPSSGLIDPYHQF